MFKTKRVKQLEQRVVELEKKVDAPRRNLQVLLDEKEVLDRNERIKSSLQPITASQNVLDGKKVAKAIYPSATHQ